MVDDELWRLWEMLPTHVGDSIGIGNLAELMELSVDRTLRLLRELEPHGARCTKGDLVSAPFIVHPAQLPGSRFVFVGSYVALRELRSAPGAER